MGELIKITLLFFLVLFSAEIGSAALIDGETKVLEVSYKKEVRTFILNAALLKKSRWSEERIKQEVAATNKILEQCGLQIRELRLYVENGKANFYREDLGIFAEELNAAGFYTLGRPLVIFATSAEGSKSKSSYGFAFYRLSSGNLKNIIFIRPYYFPNNSENLPSVLSHELGHVLLGTDHVDYPNLMSSGPSKMINGEITSEQCRALNHSKLLDDANEDWPVTEKRPVI